MSISGAMNISLSGMKAQTRQLSTAANNIANATIATQTSPSDASEVDLASEMLDVIFAEIGFKANAAVFETGADMWDVLMSIKRD